jgi:hypothetical protein
MYLFSNTDVDLKCCFSNLGKIIEQVLRHHKKYPEPTPQNYYSLLMTEVALDDNAYQVNG